MSRRPTHVHVAVISDCPLLRQALLQLIDDAPDLQSVTPARSAGAQRYEVGSADVVLLNLQDPIRDVCDLIARFRQQGYKVIILSPSNARTDLVLAIEAGARGYLSQKVGEIELLTAVRTVASDRSYFSANFSDQTAHERLRRITSRERQILDLVASGATDREIASKLNISVHTVHSHLDRLRSKTGVRRRADLTRLALEQGAGGFAVDEG
ncbi:hypothetical protein AAW14_32520 [Streptomyces hygroscopicus]|uniref:response regulator transcription factor n=1 Tax=Streptomyces hygroscopicus TaxID=1912 RepID=UPI002240485A|nr:response regulator transcription factor [Streptomyces hygroscopicus]MCW7946576.1 hypothetical protein [Streptomyces hygroscopicus]